MFSCHFFRSLLTAAHFAGGEKVRWRVFDSSCKYYVYFLQCILNAGSAEIKLSHKWNSPRKLLQAFNVALGTAPAANSYFDSHQPSDLSAFLPLFTSFVHRPRSARPSRSPDRTFALTLPTEPVIHRLLGGLQHLLGPNSQDSVPKDLHYRNVATK